MHTAPAHVCTHSTPDVWRSPISGRHLHNSPLERFHRGSTGQESVRLERNGLYNNSAWRGASGEMKTSPQRPQFTAEPLGLSKGLHTFERHELGVCLQVSSSEEKLVHQTLHQSHRLRCAAIGGTRKQSAEGASSQHHTHGTKEDEHSCAHYEIEQQTHKPSNLSRRYSAQ